MGARDEPGQTIRFARSGDRTVAWAAVGAGPPLVVGGWWMGHLELNWADPAFRAFFARWPPDHTLVRYDRPGSGLSPGAPEPSLDGEVAALTEVVTALGEAPVTLLGASSGGPVAATLAARRPDLVERLVLYGTFADGSRIALARGPGPARRPRRRPLGPGLAGAGRPVPARRDPGRARRRSRASSGPRPPPTPRPPSLAAAYAFDVRAELARVAAPTLVLHRRDDRAIPVALGRDVAATVPDASFVALEGDDHFPWRGDADAVLRAIRARVPPGSSGAPWREVTPPTSVLSPRELEVLRLVAEGLADREIARRLSLSPHTVHRHLANVRSKLDLPSRAAATAYASATTCSSRRPRAAMARPGHARRMAGRGDAPRRRSEVCCSHDHDHVPTPSANPVRGRLNAAFFRIMDRYVHRHLGDRKAALFTDLPGTVVELGAGTGRQHALLPGGDAGDRHRAQPADAPLRCGRPPPATAWTSRSARWARRTRAWPDGSVDAVVSTLVLCTVDDPAAVVAEVRRILRPGGRFLVLEHVAAPDGGPLDRLQRLLWTGWRWAFEGCDLQRHTGDLLADRGLRRRGPGALPRRLDLPAGRRPGGRDTAPLSPSAPHPCRGGGTTLPEGTMFWLVRNRLSGS